MKPKNCIYLFNPENDLALAIGADNYTPPPHAAQLRRDLQMLPLWYADGESPAILSTSPEADASWLERMHSLFGIEATAVSIAEVPQFTEFSPWGWSAYTRKRFIDYGVDANLLPDKSQLDVARMLSHRRTSIMLHELLHDRLGMELSPIPLEMSNWEEIHSFAQAHPCCFVKAPWSSSGKGIFRALQPDSIDFSRWTSGVLRRQGSVICERQLDKILDFALEFQCIEGKAKFAGYSVFSNDLHCSFDSGIVGTREHLRGIINSYLTDCSIIDSLIEAYENILSEKVAPQYSGYLGIDMLLYHQADGSVGIDPCVEMNLRTTMGVVTAKIGERFIHPQSEGTFRVTFHKTTIQSLENDLVIDGRRIVSGTIHLAPIYHGSRYSATIDVKPIQ